MPDRKFGIVIDGATGRLGTTQHLRALLDIRREDGLVLSNGDRLLPEPILLGRDSQKVAALAEKYGELRWSTDRSACLADPAVDIYFDATATGGRPERARAAFAAGTIVAHNASAATRPQRAPPDLRAMLPLPFRWYEANLIQIKRQFPCRR